MSAIRNFLHHFHSVSDEDFALLENLLQSRSYAKGELITREGQIQRELFFVEEGLQMSYHNEDGKQHVIAFTYPPGITGIPESFLSQQAARYNLQALTDSSFQAISYDNLQALFDRSQALERLFRKMTETVLVGLLERQFELQAFSIEQRFRAFAKRSPHLFQMVPHKHLASYLKIDPTNFSKLYNSIRI